MLIWNYWPGPQGGAERQCRKLSHGLSESGHDCTVVTRCSIGAQRHQEDQGVKIVRIGWLSVVVAHIFRLKDKIKARLRDGREASESSASAESSASMGGMPEKAAGIGFSTPFLWLEMVIFQLAGLVFFRKNKESFDVIHVHETHWIAGYGSWIAKLLGIPVVCKGATFPPICSIVGAVPFKRKWLRERQSAHFIALNRVIKKGFLDYGIPSNLVSVIPNGVELPDRVADVKTNRDVLVIANFSQGRLKAFDILFPAWGIVAATVPEGKLRILGGGDRREWEAFVERSDLQDRVEFLGFTKEVETHALFACCLALPSRTEGMSNALLEGMSYGLPVVVSDIPANTCVVRDGSEGVVVPVEDVDALAAGLIRILREPSERVRMGHAARVRIEAEFSVSHVVSKLDDLYHKVLGVVL